MQKNFETVTDERGNVLVGYRVRVKDASNNEVAIYADEGGTRFLDPSGNVINESLTNELGRYEFYWDAEAGQTREILDPAGVLKDQLRDFFQYPALTEVGVKNLFPEIILSHINESGFEAKMTAAKALITAAGGGTIIIDGHADLLVRQDLLNVPNLSLLPSRPGIELRAAASMNRLLWVRSNDVTVGEFKFIANGNVSTAAIEISGNNARLERPKILATGAFGVSVQDDGIVSPILNDVQVDGAVIGLRFNGSGSGARIYGGKIINTTTRGCSISASTRTVRDFYVDGLFLGVQSGDCQPFRADDGAVGDLIDVHLRNVRAIDPTSLISGSDSITFNGVKNFSAIGCISERRGDVGINASTGCEDGLITGNQCRNAYNSGINLGQLVEESPGISRVTKRVKVSGNTITNCGERHDSAAYTNANSAYLGIGALRTEDCEISNNKIISTADAINPMRDGILMHRNERLTIYGNEIRGFERSKIYQSNAVDPLTGTAVVPSTFDRIDGTFTGVPSMASGALAESNIYDTVAGKRKFYNGTAWANEGSLSSALAFGRVNASGTLSSGVNVASVTVTATGYHTIALTNPVSSTACPVTVVVEPGSDPSTSNGRLIQARLTTTSELVVRSHSSAATLAGADYWFRVDPIPT